MLTYFFLNAAIHATFKKPFLTHISVNSITIFSSGKRSTPACVHDSENFYVTFIKGNAWKLYNENQFQNDLVG